MTKQVTLSEKTIAKLNAIKGNRSYSEVISSLFPLDRSDLMQLVNHTQEALFARFLYNKAVLSNSAAIQMTRERVKGIIALLLLGDWEMMDRYLTESADIIPAAMRTGREKYDKVE